MSRFSFGLISLLIMILITGVISSFFYQKNLFDWFKDILYFSKPILGILLGYFLVKKINNKKFFLKALIYTSFLFAIYHILTVFITTDFSTDSINTIRNKNGLASPLELLALIILISSYRFDYLKVINRRKKILIFTLVLSLILYFSRTMVVAFIIMLLAVNDYTKLTTKGFKYGISLMILIGLFYFYLFSIDLKRNQPGIESFLYKIKIAPSEIFSPTKNIDIKNHKNLWDHWRAYESNLAYMQMKENPISFLNGYGFGSLVDLKFVAPLNEKGMRFIPLLHNGYVNTLFKTGFLGLFFYISFLLLLYLQSYKNKNYKDEKIIRNLVSAIGLYFIFTSLIITGIYNLEEKYSLILGGFLFLLSKIEANQINENN